MTLENRIPPPLLMFGVGVGMWLIGDFQPLMPGGPLRRVFAALLLASGLLVTVLGVARFRAAGTTIDPTRPERAAQLVVGGIYRYTRNPMYLGFTLTLLAWAVGLGSAWSLAGPVLFVLYIGRFQIAPEERALAARFGDAFHDYAGRVRRWL